MTRGLEAFRTEIAPLLKDHCVKCHGGEKTKGDLDMVTREGLLKGGEEGPAVVPFDSGASSLMKLIRHEEEPEMPEKKPKLADSDIAKIAAWIDLGAPYDAPLVAGKKPPRNKAVVSDEDRKWWAFQPLANPEVPQDATHPVDAFLMKAAAEKQLTLNPTADPRTIIRRMTLDVTGLPPAPAEVAAFTKAFEQDPNAAIAGLADRLLASAAYGERWARHWLDVARFAESSGFEHDYDRPHAFHYRDFVIRALNDDMPFDQFARWQIAGDEFAAENPLAMMATGFLGAGVFPTQITANEVERTRYDALDDMLSTTASAFLGLTVGCARCHDHKFDPIPTRDYYRLLSTFTTTVRSNVELEIDPEKAKAAKADWAKNGEALKAELERTGESLRPAFEQWIKSQPGTAADETWTLIEAPEWKSSGKASFKSLGDGSFLVEGPNANQDTYTVTAPIAEGRLTALRLEALAHPSMKQKGPGRAGNGNFALAKITVSITAPGAPATELKIARAFADHEQNNGSLSVASSLDEDISSGWAVDGQIGKDHAAAFVFAEPVTVPAGAKLTVKLSFTVNTQHNIGRPRIAVTAGTEPKLEGAAVSEVIATALKKLRNGTPIAPDERIALFDCWKQQEPAWQTANTRLAEHNAKEPNSRTPVMVCAEGFPPIVMHSQGAPFLEQTHFLKRGDTNQKDGVAPQGYLEVLMRGADEQKWAWRPPEGSKFSGRRRSFANWLTDVDNGAGALVARVIVNRLWQHHFGRGLVASTNDFGRTGTPPSHPELLDWLAGELIRNGWQLKPIHRLLLTSTAYQQSTAADAKKLTADPDNALFLRRTPQRLEAEAVRDSALAVSGLLDATMFGAGTLDENSRRRSIYFTVKRSRLMNSMLVFDAPEPLISQGSRPTTTVAPQALLLMNSPQIRQWAAGFARRIESEISRGTPANYVKHAYELALGRAPKTIELQNATEFLTRGIATYAAANYQQPQTQALADFCQAVLSLNEFVYVN
jgi:mono/diheme cytochrome c family protein